MTDCHQANAPPPTVPIGSQQQQKPAAVPGPNARPFTDDEWLLVEANIQKTLEEQAARENQPEDPASAESPVNAKRPPGEEDEENGENSDGEGSLPDYEESEYDESNDGEDNGG